MRTRHSHKISPDEISENVQLPQFKTVYHRENSHSHISSLLKETSPDSFLSLQSDVLSSFNTLSSSLIAQNSHFIVLQGPKSSGKSAFVHSLIKNLSSHIPAKIISSSLLNQHLISSPDSLESELRSSILISLTEEKTIITGEVTHIEYFFSTKPSEPQPEKVKEELAFPISGKIHLRTSNIESSFIMGPLLCQKVIAEQITSGDIISICKTSGDFQRLGRSKKYVVDDEIYNSFQNFQEIPKNELLKNIKENQNMTLKEMDILNSTKDTVNSIYKNGIESVSSAFVREEVDEQVRSWVEQKRAKVFKGLIVVEDSDLLSEGALSVIENMKESSFCPSFLFVTRQELVERDGRVLPCGFSIDFLESCLVLRTRNYKENEIVKIFEKLINSNVSKLMGKIGMVEGLEYAVRVGKKAVEIKGNKESVGEGDVEEICGKFLSGRRMKEVNKEKRKHFGTDKVKYK